MKTPSQSRIRRLFSRIFKIRTWSDLDRTQTIFNYIKQLVIHLFILKDLQDNDLTFDSVIQRKKVTQPQLILQARDLHRLSWLMVIVALIILCYVAYQLVYGTLVSILLSLIVFMIALTLAFRYSYWRFIIQQRNFSVSLYSWFKHVLLRKQT